MDIPSATYRIQFTPDFGFDHARAIANYLGDLGISDLYASPILKARSGSTHGYDAVDPTRLNPELGTQETFEALIAALQARNIGWLQDIVPNHMAYDSQNLFLMDVLEHGPHSEYFNYFDIEWEHPYGDISGRVLTPLLGDFYGNCLERGEIQLAYDASGLTVNYYSLRLPVRIESYSSILTYHQEQLGELLDRTHPAFIKLLGILYLIKSIPQDATSQQLKEQRKDQVNFAKALLWELYSQTTEIRHFIDENLAAFNGTPGQPESFNLLDDLLSKQFFRLSFWKVGAEELNYRRFFTINELICLRVEEPDVFDATHALIRQMVTAKQITGLRIDHIDGLYYPSAYLQRLREAMGDIYITVEKILELGRDYFTGAEELPEEWVVQGTTGYDFVNALNLLFCQRENQRQLSELYTRFTGMTTPYEQLILEKKRLIADKNLAGDVENLANLLKRLAGHHRYGRDFTLNGLRKAILEVLVLFPVYRTYANDQGLRDRDRLYVQEVTREAIARLPILTNELQFLGRVLLLDYDEYLPDSEKNQWLRFAMKFQQFSGPLMAKGFEDTFLYAYHRLVSLNEVGSSPYPFGITISAFHNFNQRRRDRWPHTMNASSTHDTKRSEDLRARINVLSELPEDWAKEVLIWRDLNQAQKTVSEGRIIPDLNDEYFLYQTLVGAFPLPGQEMSTFCDRIKDYVIKAVREAKIHTAWLRPDMGYEEGFVAFVEKILTPEENPFFERLQEFQARIAFYGMLNSLSQTLLKGAAPGVPDYYQGTELWDLSLVDPDNRRPVDFELRSQYLREIQERLSANDPRLVRDLIQTWEDGRIKLFLTAQTLAARQQYKEVFQLGEYIPLEVLGTHRDRIIAFARRYGSQAIIAIAPRFLTSMITPGTWPLGAALWADTQLEIPDWLTADWQNLLTSQTLTSTGNLDLGEIFSDLPVALLASVPTVREA